jgi:RNA polymerase sigma-70 factor, ECF subfamily
MYVRSLLTPPVRSYMIWKLLRGIVSTEDLPLDEPIPGSSVGEITEVLQRANLTDPKTQDRLLALLYPQLKRIAEMRMSRERADHTLQPTALVNEFYLHVARLQGLSWKNRAHFLAVASNAMRRVLVDYARGHNAEKRNVAKIVSLTDHDKGSIDHAFDALEIHDLLNHLALEEPRMARVIELRYFGGLTHAEAAEVLNVDERTVKRDWQVARAWLLAQLQKKH